MGADECLSDAGADQRMRRPVHSEASMPGGATGQVTWCPGAKTIGMTPTGRMGASSGLAFDRGNGGRGNGGRDRPTFRPQKAGGVDSLRCACPVPTACAAGCASPARPNPCTPSAHGDVRRGAGGKQTGFGGGYCRAIITSLLWRSSESGSMAAAKASRWDAGRGSPAGNFTVSGFTNLPALDSAKWR